MVTLQDDQDLARCDGTIRVESTVGIGSCFTLANCASRESPIASAALPDTALRIVPAGTRKEANRVDRVTDTGCQLTPAAIAVPTTTEQ